MSPWIARIGLPILLGATVGLFVWIGRETEPGPALKSEPNPEAVVVMPAAPVRTPGSFPTAAPVSEPSLEEADVATRQRFYDSLADQPPRLLLSRLLRQPGDETTREILLHAFTTSMAENGRDPTFAGPLADALSSPDYSLELKALLAESLAESSTLAGVTALLQVAEAPASPPELRSVLNEAIAMVGAKRRGDGTFPMDLSPVLEAAFLRAALTPQSNPDLVSATSLAIAQVGSENGVRVLLQKIPTLPQTAEVVPRVRNPAAIPALLEPLQITTDYQDPRMAAAGKALVHIGGDAAVRPVLEWLKNASDEAQPLAADWFANIREPVSYDLVGTYLSSGQFRNESIRTTLQRAYDLNTPEEVPRGR